MLAALPALVLFMRDLEPSGLGLAYLLPSPGRVIQRLTVEPEWIAYSNLEWVPFAAGLGFPILVASWHAAGRWRQRRIAPADRFALAAAIVGGLFVTVPEFMASGGFVTARLLLCTAVLAALWVATSPWSPRWRIALASTGVVATIALAAINGASYRRYDRLLDEQARALSLVPPHATLLPLSVADSGVEPDPRVFSNRPRPFVHAAGRIGSGSDVFLYGNYQAEAPHFPIRFKPGAPVPNQTTVDEFPWGDRLELPAPTSAAGGDYVTIWGPVDSPAFAGSGLPRVMSELRRDYESVYDSGPGGLLRIWRRRQPDAAAAPTPH
jgi:hypothetical protein